MNKSQGSSKELAAKRSAFILLSIWIVINTLLLLAYFVAESLFGEFAYRLITTSLYLAVFVLGIFLVLTKSQSVMLLNKKQAEFNQSQREQIIKITHLGSELSERETAIHRIEAALEYASDSIAIMDPDGGLTFINPAFGYLFRHTIESIHREGVVSIFVDKDIASEAFSSALLGDSYEDEILMKSLDNRELVAYFRSSAILDDQFNTQGVLFTITDVTEKKNLEEKLRSMAQRDSLTNLANRRAFDEVFAKEWGRSKRDKSTLSVLMMDIDYFKFYNDTYGHLRGDDCLKSVSKVLSSVPRRSIDVVARYGGEEFICLIPSTPTAGVAHIAQVMLEGVSGLEIEHSASKVAPYVTISIGVASLVPADDNDPADLVRLADFALYKAKDEGRNRINVLSDVETKEQLENANGRTLHVDS